jgi:hypothetical protein
MTEDEQNWEEHGVAPFRTRITNLRLSSKEKAVEVLHPNTVGASEEERAALWPLRAEIPTNAWSQ